MQSRGDPKPSGQNAPSAHGWAIFWISVLGLYLELLVIRWIGTEIRIFAYLQNTVLVVCFLGLGIGLFTSRRRVVWWRGAGALALLAAGLAVPSSRRLLQGISEALSVLQDINIWGGAEYLPPDLQAKSLLVGLILAFVVMVLTVEMFVPIGRLLGRLLDEHRRPIVAYSLNIGGSLAGVWLFVGLSRLSQPPEVWFGVLLLVAAAGIRGSRRRWLELSALAATVGLVAAARSDPAAVETVWSPYQKLSLIDLEKAKDRYSYSGEYLVEVNNIGYQLLLDLGGQTAVGEDAGHDEQLSGLETRGRFRVGLYDVPPLVHPDPRDVLVVGAGTGNDVAAMLRHGAGRVTAVDIDPVILEFGRRFHPERPYDSPRVRPVINDARSFFATTDETYDLISFGLLDSHTTTALTNARLDHYVYTRQSLAAAKRLLRPGGILTLAFDPIQPFVIDRLAATLREVFEEEPLAYRFHVDEHGQRGVLLIAGDLETARSRIRLAPELEDLRVTAVERAWRLQYETAPATDDWPYLYLAGPQIPPLFGLLAGLLGLLILWARWSLDLPRAMNPVCWLRAEWHFFFLGAAFLLLEVQSISKAAVVLGNTWLVNAVIISGVLVMILAANVLVLANVRPRLELVYAGLVAIVVGLFFVDLARFAFLPYAGKAAIVGGLTTVPMLFSGIAFARAFEVAERRDLAFGANLLGALVGAVLESVSFLTGIKSLLLLVAAFYLMAAATRPRRTGELAIEVGSPVSGGRGHGLTAAPAAVDRGG